MIGSSAQLMRVDRVARRRLGGVRCSLAGLDLQALDRRRYLRLTDLAAGWRSPTTQRDVIDHLGKAERYDPAAGQSIHLWPGHRT